MKKFLLSLAGICMALSLSAQEKVDHLYLDMRTSFHQELTDGTYGSQLMG